ncbi:hypothetical protein [Bradyrhizobium embrapense]|uniref:hypothetical protein n=1 Tax=Bradyrhizobium embrapense TaxID=630921 RepID=UPI0012F4B6F5|nr:hypothetical protein [Bradyrhizobium embrapense]
MAERLPQVLGVLNRRGRAGAFGLLAWNEFAIGPIVRQGNEVCDLVHRWPFLVWSTSPTNNGSAKTILICLGPFRLIGINAEWRISLLHARALTGD